MDFGKRGIVMSAPQPPRTELRGRNADSVTAWRIYERTVTEMAPRFDAFVEASEKNRIASAQLHGSMRVQNFWMAALTFSVALNVWRMW